MQSRRKVLGVEFEVSGAREVDAEAVPVSFCDNEIPEFVYVYAGDHAVPLNLESRVNYEGRCRNRREADTAPFGRPPRLFKGQPWEYKTSF